ncbi:DUF2254 domain-containing protein [Oceanomicrobium pacificus]|uniref:DUF2254 domain-containing protein n=1 Tax=Oceanomicrobium pacificus TaxID=2692916 RepID=A0A6B0TIQ3_9RHOB|nr:DUF2254 domain-containing protein [Oceanomicrobium pacificus]MXU64300.1 DUF2254 domain-containing protein [Oceanomicrobium pacificus]
MNPLSWLPKLAQDIRASYWFIPSVLTVLAIVAAQFSIWFDHDTELMDTLLPDSASDTQAEGARTTLAVISQSVIGVTGVMFSMTLVAVSFASGNFGPRLIGNFMRDRGNQWSLGILISTFVYALIILRAVQSPVGEDVDLFVPQLSLIVALGLTFVSVGTVIYFVHHVPETINVANITAALGKALCADVRALIDSRRDRAETAPVALPDRAPDREVRLDRAGYVQTLDHDRIDRLAEEEGWIVEITADPGQFVSPHTPVARLWTASAPGDDPLEELRGSFILGDIQTEAQNLEFIVAQLVEMLARALSPGVNDPFTAMSCLDWLYAGTEAAICHRGGLSVPPAGRVHHRQLDAAILLDAGLGASRAYVAGDRLATDHFNMLLDRLLDRTGQGDLADRIAGLRIAAPPKADAPV